MRRLAGIEKHEGEIAAIMASEPKQASGKKQRTDERTARQRIYDWFFGFSYTTRVTVTFSLVAIMTVVVAMGVLSYVWEEHFQAYTRENVQQLADTTAANIANRYERSNSATLDAIGEGNKMSYPSLSINDVEPAESVHMLQPGMGIQVISSSTETVVYDSSRPNGSSYSSSNSIDETGSFAPSINRITKTAQEIKEGNLSARVNLDGKDEIAELAKTFDAMAESVESNQELERRLTTDVAHELRTPLMAIQSTVEAIMDGVFEADEERLNTIDAEVQRLSRLVDAILKLSRLESRSTPMNEEVVDVGDLIRPLVMSHEAFVNDAGLTLEYDAEPDVIVYGDRDMLRQATANLISNAVRYTPAPGKITVSVKRGDVMAAIAVRDTGIGLSPEERRMVFKRFWRAEESRQRQSGGLGVGLAVVKEIVDRHGGWVQVEGKKGEGACFTIHVPLYDEERIKAQKEKANSKERGAKAQAAKRKGRN